MKPHHRGDTLPEPFLNAPFKSIISTKPVMTKFQTLLIKLLDTEIIWNRIDFI